jgi:hypothetical protein|tara:strand:+ start:4491 stop:4826 length:336 start_codon:yes stop_codon:yes gene_type:complete
MKNIKFCCKLFEKLKDREEKHEEFIILDYFSLKTLQLIKEYDIKIAKRYIEMFREFELKCTSSKKIKEWSNFFYTLSIMLENKYFYDIAIQENQVEVESFYENLNKIVKEV